MPKYSLLPLLILLYLPAAAADDSGRLQLADAVDNEITLYTNNALIKQTFVALPDKKGTLVLQGFDSSWQQNGFLLQYTGADKPYFAEKVWWRHGALNRDSLYTKLVGQTVDLAGETIDEPLQGKLLAYDAGIGLVQGDDRRQYIIDLDDPQGIRLTPSENAFSQRDYAGDMIAEFGKQKPQGTLGLTYLSPLLSYTSRYRLTREKNNQSWLERVLTLKNTSNIDYKNTVIHLVSGDINESPRGRLETAYAKAAADGASASMDERVGELLVTPLKGTWTLPAHTSTQISQYKQENIAFEEHYLLEVYGGAFGSPPPALEHPRLILRFKAGADLAAGRVEIFEQNKDGASLLSGNARLAATVKGDSARLVLGEAFTVRVDRQRVTGRQSGNTVQTQWKTTVYNDRQSPITFILDDRQHNLIKLSAVEGGTPEGSSRIKVTVPAKGQKTIQYTAAYSR